MTNSLLLNIILAGFFFLTTFYCVSCDNDDFTPKVNFDPESHGQKILNGAKDLDFVPHYIKQYGVRGKNYDLDENRVPFIWCETFNRADCHSENITDCMKSERCVPERRTHQLGCMAVFVYNVSQEGNNLPEILQEPALKGCWSQDAFELRECNAHDQCIVETRSTGSNRLAQFCCCRTHNCNKIISFQQQMTQNETDIEPLPSDTPDEPETAEEPTGHYMYTVIFISVSLLGVLCLGLTALYIFHFRRKNVREVVQEDKIEPPISPSNMIPMRRLEYNAQCMAVINGKLIDLRNTKLKEKISKGRFGEVYRGEIEGTYLAVKLCTKLESDSWINEQDIYAVRSMRKHDNIAEFVASFEYDHRYWLVTQFYNFGSLFDYLQGHTLSLVECSKIIAGFLNGLAFLHEEIALGLRQKPTIIHRDFKSKNVLIKDNLTSCISDFGLAMKYDQYTLADDLHGQVGTRRYMAPEVLEGATEFTAFAFQQIDVYAAALVMWEVLNRTEVDCHVDFEPFGVPAAKLPYESEVGVSPTLGPLREYVVLKKSRPIIRQCLSRDSCTSKLVNTMKEMWEMEPDARITSGCARDRVIRVYEEVSGVPYTVEMDTTPETWCDSHGYQIPVIRTTNFVRREETVANADGDAETALITRLIS